jgi:hypothetical protein
MTDFEKIVVTAVFTISGGVIVYVVGQILSKFFIEPLHDLRKAVGEVRFNLAFHAPTIHTPIGRSKESSDEAREALSKSSCELIANLHATPYYGVTRFLAFGVLPSRNAIEDAAVQLRGLSTYVHETGEKATAQLDVVRKRVERIEKLLRLKPLE